MKLLLDTHVLVWWLRDNPRLGSRTRALIADPRAELLVSIASFWELAIKARRKGFEYPGSVLLREARAAGLEVVAIDERHLDLLEQLEPRPGHKDPFDHLILVQAQAEEAMLITSDRKLRDYEAR